MTLTYLFSAEVIPPTKITFFAVCGRICEETARDIEITSMNKYEEIEYGLSNDQQHQNESPNFTSSSYFEVDIMRKKLNFQCSINKTLLLSCSDQQLSVVKLFV